MIDPMRRLNSRQRLTVVIRGVNILIVLALLAFALR
jgi:hypothetical protein